MTLRISGHNLYKIFGANPSKALSLLKAGKSREQIFAETGQAIGVRDVSFDVAEGEIFVIMGLSGSGKSTLIRMINGLVRPSAGKVLLDGIDIADCSEAKLRELRRAKVAMVFQHFALFPHKTVAENVAFGLKIGGVKAAERRERARSALEQVGLATRADSYPDELSGGMQQRVGLARALASEAEILLMDEPFSALDPLIRSDMQQELLELQRALKKTILFVTHDLSEALLLGNSIAIMRDGAIVQTGTAEEIVGSPADDYVAEFTKGVDRSVVFTAQSIAGPPDALDIEGADARTALDRMDALGIDAIHVVEDGRPVGIVTYRAAHAALDDDDGEFGDAVSSDFPVSSPPARLFELYPLAQAGLPIALTDGKQQLSGVVRPQAVFAQLAGEGN